MRKEILRMERVTYKEADMVRLDDFNLQIYEGEIMGMLPFNGQGMNALLGLLQVNRPLYDGYIYYNGELINSWKESSGTHNRIGIIQAKSSLIETQTIADNVFVLRHGFRQEIIHTKLLNRQLQPFLKEIGMEMPADARIESLSVFQRIIVELLRSVVAGNHLIVLEEIGALLSDRELEQLHRILRHYAEQGISFLYVSPHFEEEHEVCDRIAFLTNGRIWKVIPKEMIKNQTWEIYDYNRYNREYNQMVRLHLEKRQQEDSEKEQLRVWSHNSEAAGRQISFPVYKGEYLAVQIHENKILQEMTKILMEEVSGDDRSAVIQESPTSSMLFTGLSYMDNLCMSLSRRMGNIWKTKKIRNSIRQEYEQLLGEEVFDQKVENLSQKQKYQLIYSRVLLQNPQIVYCIKPFRGADLAHRIHIWKLLEMLLDKGITVVDISLNLSDSLSLADRLLMIEHDGSVKEIPKEEFASVPRNVPWGTFYRGET